MIVLVIGATGELGAAVARALVDQRVAVRAMTRRPVDLGIEGIERVVRADLADPASLADAFAGVERLFLISSPGPDQVALERNAVEAAEHAGVQHIVKVSNIPIAGLDEGLHGNHRAIERRLGESVIGSTVL